jgi:hypothetical protein
MSNLSSDPIVFNIFHVLICFIGMHCMILLEIYIFLIPKDECV